MRIWRTNQQLLGQGAQAPTGWVAGDLMPSTALPGTYLLRNDDGTIFSVSGDGTMHNLPAGTDTAHEQCYLPESRAQIAYAATGYVFGIVIFP